MRKKKLLQQREEGKVYEKEIICISASYKYGIRYV